MKPLTWNIYFKKLLIENDFLYYWTLNPAQLRMPIIKNYEDASKNCSYTQMKKKNPLLSPHITARWNSLHYISKLRKLGFRAQGQLWSSTLLDYQTLETDGAGAWTPRTTTAPRLYHAEPGLLARHGCLVGCGSCPFQERPLDTTFTKQVRMMAAKTEILAS